MKAPFGCLFLFALHAEQPGELRFFNQETLVTLSNGKTTNRQGRYRQRWGLPRKWWLTPKEAEASKWNIAQANRCWQVKRVSLQKVTKPDNWNSLICLDGWIHLQGTLLNRGSLYHWRIIRGRSSRKTRVVFIVVQVADESVVVKNRKPVKRW
jgi:hypothetical protein